MAVVVAVVGYWNFVDADSSPKKEPPNLGPVVVMKISLLWVNINLSVSDSGQLLLVPEATVVPGVAMKQKAVTWVKFF